MYQENGVLYLRDAQPANTGEYYCTSTNAYGQGDSRVFINVLASELSPRDELIIVQVSYMCSETTGYVTDSTYGIDLHFLVGNVHPK